jgi:hypothetical protein
MAEGGFSITGLQDVLRQKTEDIEAEITAMSNTSEMNVAQFLGLQFMVNLFSQLSTTATNIMSAFNDAINASARNIK